MILSIVLTLIRIINKTVRLKINFVQEVDFTFAVSCFYFCGDMLQEADIRSKSGPDT